MSHRPPGAPAAAAPLYAGYQVYLAHTEQMFVFRPRDGATGPDYLVQATPPPSTGLNLLGVVRVAGADGVPQYTVAGAGEIAQAGDATTWEPAATPEQAVALLHEIGVYGPRIHTTPDGGYYRAAPTAWTTPRWMVTRFAPGQAPVRLGAYHAGAAGSPLVVMIPAPRQVADPAAAVAALEGYYAAQEAAAAAAEALIG